MLAYDERGFASNPVVIDVKDASPAGGKPDVWVVSVGVSKYPNLSADYQLALAEEDAKGVVAAFDDQAGEGKAFAAAHAKLLLGPEAAPDRIAAALRELAAMKPEDIAERVMRATKGQQTPWVARREILGDFGVAASGKGR